MLVMCVIMSVIQIPLYIISVATCCTLYQAYYICVNRPGWPWAANTVIVKLSVRDLIQDYI